MPRHDRSLRHLIPASRGFASTALVLLLALWTAPAMAMGEGGGGGGGSGGGSGGGGGGMGGDGGGGGRGGGGDRDTLYPAFCAKGQVYDTRLNKCVRSELGFPRQTFARLSGIADPE